MAAAVAFVALSAGAFGIAGCGSDSADLPKGTAARVGDAPITQAELDRQVGQSLAAFETQGQAAPVKDSKEYTQLVQQAMQTLVMQKIIRAEAAECGTPCIVKPAAVTKELKGIITTEFKDSRKDFDAFLKERKLTNDDAREIVLNSLLQQRLYDNVTRGVRFSTDDAKTYYDEHKDQFSTPAGRKASHILVATEAEAEAIRAGLTLANFAQVAKEKSTDPGSATQGGDLGIIQKGQLVPEFEKVAFSLKDGQISQPVETQFGWHIITVHLVPASTTPFAEARKGIISSQLEQKRQETYNTWAEDAISGWEERTVYASDDLKPADTTATTGTEGDTAP